MCRKCHKSHDVSAAQIVSRWLECDLHEQPPICTDCHGTHRMDRAAEGKGQQKGAAQQANARTQKVFSRRNVIDDPAVLRYPIGVEL
jgi:hypothetical protein